MQVPLFTCIQFTGPLIALVICAVVLLTVNLRVNLVILNFYLWLTSLVCLQ